MNPTLEERLNYLTESLTGYSVEPKAGSALSLMMGHLIDPANPDTQKVIEIASKVLEKEILFYKNVVNPTVASTVDRAKQAIDKKFFELTPEVPTITELYVPEFVMELIDRNVVRESAGGSLDGVNITIPVQDDIVTYTAFSNGTLSELVNQFVSTKGTTFFRNVWTKYLTDVSQTNTELFALLNSGFSSKYSNFDDLFAVYILVRGLQKKIPENIRMSLSEYEHGMTQLAKKLEAAIYKRVLKFREKEEKGLVALSFEDKVIYVSGNNYQKFLQTGLEVEVLFGAVMRENKTWALTELKEKAKDLNEVFTKMYSAKVVEQNAMLDKQLKMVLASVFKDTIDGGLPEGSCFTPEQLRDFTSELLKQSRMVTKETVPEIVKNWVIRVYFAHTNASTFFNYVEMYTGKGFNLELDKAILFAIVEMVIDFFVEETNVSRI